ncbi:Lysophosphatidylcholine acyltransferase 2 [Perkinsus chesapeaki]|uniref:Lysophosphatidylcholine acyltransferase 2 n=1 Tax=Perkinsus chesapeaki TaxID=330153 RepID=A0A7J6MRF7_PERCH|nr:Lysophosphatidylcholine acyltransferase 2 [Perkinsus chesapeaki]
MESSYKFKVEGDAHPMDIGDLILRVSMKSQHTIVLQAQGSAATAVAVKGFIEANSPRSHTCHLVVSGAPADEVGKKGGPSTVVWLSSYISEDPTLFKEREVETMVVSNHTRPAPLSGSISSSIEQGHIVRLQGAGPHCLRKMAEALAISGKHFSKDRKARPAAQRRPGLLVCWPKFMAGHQTNSGGRDRPPKGVVEIYVALEEYLMEMEEEKQEPFEAKEHLLDAAKPLRMVKLNGHAPAAVTAAAALHFVLMMLTQFSTRRVSGLLSMMSLRSSRAFRTSATKEMQEVADRLRVTSTADPLELAPFIRQRLGTPNRPNMVVLQAERLINGMSGSCCGSISGKFPLENCQSVAYASSRRGQTIPMDVTITGPPDDGIPDRGGGDLWIAVARQGFRQRLQEKESDPTEVQDVIIGHNTAPHKIAGVITNALLAGRTVRMTGFSSAGIIKIANAITISGHHCQTFDKVEDRGRLVTSVRTALRAVNPRGAPTDHDDTHEEHHDEEASVEGNDKVEHAVGGDDVEGEVTENGGHKILITAVEFTCRLQKTKSDSFSLPPSEELARCPPFAMWSEVNFEYTKFCHPTNVCEILPKRFRKAGDMATMRAVGVPIRAGKAFKTFIDMCPKVRNSGWIEIICSGPPAVEVAAEDDDGSSRQAELWIHGRIRAKGGTSLKEPSEPVEVKLEKGWDMAQEAERIAEILTKERKQVQLRIILSVIATTTNVRLTLIAELLARVGRLCNNVEGFETHELLTRITPTSIQFKRKGALSEMKEGREKAGTITNPGVDLLLRLHPQPTINNPLQTQRPAEKDMAESDFQFRIKKEAELNEVVTLLAHTLRNQYSTVVLRGRHPSSVLMSLKAVTAAAYRASKVIDLTFRGPPLEWPTTEQKEEFERWAEMEGGTEIWIGARIGQAHCGGRAWEDILVQPEMSSAELAATVSELIKRESSLRIIGLDAVSCATIADAIAIASQTCGLVCQADFTKVNVDPRNHRPVGESIPDGLDAEDLITESVFGLRIGAYGLKADISSEPNAWTDQRSTFPHQGRLRTFWTYSGVEKPSAIIFTLVDWDPVQDKCERWQKEDMVLYGIKQRAKKFNATLVTPCPLQSPTVEPGTIWGWGYNAGTCCQSNKSVDDIDFARQLIPEVERRIGTTNMPVYALGLSNGGMLAEALSCYNIVSQAASVAGILTLEPGLKRGYKVCDDAFKPTPSEVQRVIKIHGKDDKLVRYDGGRDDMLPFLTFPSVESDFSKWAKRMNCNRKSRRRVGQRGGAVLEAYTTCPVGKEVYLASMERVGHAWPTRGGIGNFSAARTIFKFFYGRL